MSAVRPAAVAGTFYPADAAALLSQVKRCLAGPTGQKSGTPPKLLIVPHAGYVYSGPIAGRAFARLAPWAASIRRVVLLGPAHRVAFRGLDVPTVDGFDTPLGRIPIDAAARDALADLQQVVCDDRAHALEHSLEVQLPFLQAVLGKAFKLLPLAVGDIDGERVAQVLERLWGGDETLIVISTDLSHYLPYADARNTDRMTAARIVELATDFDPFEACGARALNGAMLAARLQSVRSRPARHIRPPEDGRQRYRLSCADRAIRRAGHAAEPPDCEDANLGAALLSRARNSIAARLGLPQREPEPPHPAMSRAGASFVTLRDANGELRGCIGRLDAVMALEDDVRHHAAAAAFEDPRFEQLRASEWPGLNIEISLLDRTESLPPAATREQALRQLRPDVDGVIFEWREHRSTLLPQVWQQLPDPKDFFAALLNKAGLPADFWAEDVSLKRYRVQHFASATSAGAGPQ